MCGITGIYLKNNDPLISNRIQKMTDSIEHRGPDADGIYVDGKIALGHRRLSIIDTRDIANQPMTSANEEWVLIFNGEIYNFQEIQKDLSYSFKTTSDTEVILAAVSEKGIDWFLNRANGMFSIALYNKATGNLYLVRDRMGIKPLYYYSSKDKIVFASEIKAILSSGLVDASFNEAAVDEYLANRYVRHPYTFFKDIFQVKPGSYVVIKPNLRPESICFWELPEEFNVASEYNEEEIANRFEEELIKAIKYRLIADVPLGTYLSGGVDSSLITAITALNKKETVNTYTIGFKELNEFEYARMIADQYKTCHHEILMEKEDYMKQWDRLISFKDSPLGVPNEIPLAIMSSKLKEKITVVLSGEGADELLGGYGRIFRLPFDCGDIDSKSFYERFISYYEYVPRKMRDDLINTPTDYRTEFDRLLQDQFQGRSNEENVFRFFHNYHVKGLLRRVDMTTMQTAVEGRVPFLDHNLIEFSYKHVPYDLKLRWKNDSARQLAINQKANQYSEVLDIPKYLLRKLSYKYLPKEVIERKKVGFPVPLTHWFENLEEIAREKLKDSSWLKPGVIDDLIDQSKTESRAGQILWMFINIEIFREKYFTKNWRW
ncbi:asparagine synthase (glutamine-hydrolyzing) [Muriicola sp. E247]|uniref:asparagine synthase (glutamine-hydrolyzing) n=1 Tax=unclassified Muriicola TaxID=2647561 RepID=UPI00350EE981